MNYNNIEMNKYVSNYQLDWDLSCTADKIDPRKVYPSTNDGTVEIITCNDSPR